MVTVSSDTQVPIATVRKLTGFSQLPDGWHFGEGVPPSASVIKFSLHLLESATNLGFFDTDAFAGTAGQVRITIYRNEYYLEFTSYADGSVTYRREDSDDEVAYLEGQTLSQAVEHIRDFRQELSALRGDICTLSGSSIQPTTTSTAGDFRVLSFRTQVSAVSLSSVPTVSTQTVSPFAGIWRDITEALAEYRKFSGGSRQTYFQTAAS